MIFLKPPFCRKQLLDLWRKKQDVEVFANCHKEKAADSPLLHTLFELCFKDERPTRPSPSLALCQMTGVAEGDEALKQKVPSRFLWPPQTQKCIKIAVVGRWVPAAGAQLHTSVCRRPICDASTSERGGERLVKKAHPINPEPKLRCQPLPCHPPNHDSSSSILSWKLSAYAAANSLKPPPSLAPSFFIAASIFLA